MGTVVQAHNHEQIRILATLSTMLVLSTGIFFLRLWARRISVARYWWDDYMAGVALVCLIQESLSSIKAYYPIDSILRSYNMRNNR